MAQRRMFSQRIVGEEKFLEMPQSAQNLYFHLGIYADDDGFINPQKVVRMIGANPDDLKVLLVKKFVIPFESGVVVITNWKENNYIQSDRYNPTIYQEELKQLSCIQNVYSLDTQVRIGKVRIGKVRIGKVNIEDKSSVDPLHYKNTTHKETAELFDYFKTEYQNKISDDPPVFNWGKCEKIAKPIIKSLGVAKLKELVNKYFERNDKFYQKVGWSLDIFLAANTINSLLNGK